MPDSILAPIKHPPDAHFESIAAIASCSKKRRFGVYPTVAVHLNSLVRQECIIRLKHVSDALAMQMQPSFPSDASSKIRTRYIVRVEGFHCRMGAPSGLGDGAKGVLQRLRARFGSRGAGSLGEPAFVRNAYAEYTSEEQPNAEEWMSFAEDILQGNVSVNAKLELLNIFLQSKTVLVGNGTRITLADLGVFVSIRDSVAAIPLEEQEKLPNLFRWFDYIQNKVDVRQVYQLIPVTKPNFAPPNLSALDPNKQAKATISDGKTVNEQDSKQVPAKPEGPAEKATKADSASEKKQESQSRDGVVSAKSSQDPIKDKQVKEKKEKPPAQKKEAECDISVCDICVGQIKKVWKHPSADTLYVEEIDVGEPQPRQVVSGLVKYVPENEMLNRRVLVLLNIKAGKVRDVLSSGLVLCASNEDHSKCQPVAPPDGAQIGDRVKFEGHEGKPEDVLNPKKKQWEKIAPELRTDADGVANYQGIPFNTSAGVCKSSIVNGTIK